MTNIHPDKVRHEILLSSIEDIWERIGYSPIPGTFKLAPSDTFFILGPTRGKAGKKIKLVYQKKLIFVLKITSGNQN